MFRVRLWDEREGKEETGREAKSVTTPGALGNSDHQTVSPQNRNGGVG